MPHSMRPRRLMVLTPHRVFYQGWLGRQMKPRRFGAFTLYCAPRGDFRVRQGGAWLRRRLAAFDPFEPHQLDAKGQMIICVCLEPERVDAGAWRALRDTLNDPASAGPLAQRLRAAPSALKALGQMPGCAALDRAVLGAPVPVRRLDPCIDTVLERIDTSLEETPISADMLAADIGLSTSRFLHLFKDQTGISFRNLRMWKRARRFLEHAAQDTSLTEVALDLGYPDSSHFSHSIRKIYGLMPRHIREGSRGLTVIGSAGAPRLGASA